MYDRGAVFLKSGDNLHQDVLGLAFELMRIGEHSGNHVVNQRRKKTARFNALPWHHIPSGWLPLC
jgi:hypothetical protein